MEQGYSTNRGMTAGNILDYTFHVYYKNFKVILFFSALIAGIFNLIYIWVTNAVSFEGTTANLWEFILQAVETGDISSIINNAAIPDVNYGSQWMISSFIFQGISALMGIISTVFIMPFVQGAVTGITYQYALGTKLDIKGALDLSLRKLWKLVVTALCLLLYYLGIGIVLFIIAIISIFPLVGMGFIIGNNPTAGSIIGLVVMVIFIILLLASSLIVAQVFISFTYPAVIAEGVFHFNAMGRSFKLVGKRFWKVLGVTLLVNLISLVIMLLVGVVVFIFMMLTRNASLAEFIFPFLITSIVAPIGYIASTVLYMDVRRQVEASDDGGGYF